MFGRAAPGLRLNEHIVADDPTVFAMRARWGPDFHLPKPVVSQSS
jgi:hypothetical protein